MKQTSEQTVAQLAKNPARIAEITGSLTAAELQTPPGPDKWSFNDILAHLRACSDVWGKYMAEIARGDTVVKTVSPRTWMRKTDYPQQEFAESFKAFSVQRADLLSLLETLTPDAWSRTTTVTKSGKSYERNVLFYANNLTLHELEHLEQMQQMVERLHGQDGRRL